MNMDIKKQGKKLPLGKLMLMNQRNMRTSIIGIDSTALTICG